MNQRLAVARDLVRQGAAAALESYGRVSGRLKGNLTPVTEVDLAVESVIVDGLRRHFPGEAVVGEETGRSGSLEGLAWAVDPIDGTAAYLSRLPHWGVSLGLLDRGEPVLGVVCLPALGETYVAARGHGAWLETERWGREPLEATRAAEATSESLLCAASNLHRRYRVDFPGKIRCLGSTVAHVLLVARGDAVGAFGRVHLWDLAACVAILLEAGGRVSTLEGGPLRLVDLVPERDPVPTALAAAPAFLEPLQRAVRRLGPGEAWET